MEHDRTSYPPRQLAAPQLRMLLTLARELLQADEVGQTLDLVGSALVELMHPDANVLLLNGDGLDIVEFDSIGFSRPAGKDHPLYETGMLLLPDASGTKAVEPHANSQYGKAGLRTLAIAVPAYAAAAIFVARWDKDLDSDERDRYQRTIIAILELAAAALGKINARSSLERLVEHQRQQMDSTSLSHSAELVRRDEAASALNALSLTDVLTGLHNRRGFFVQAEHLHMVTRRQRVNSAVIFADIDGLKSVNDEFGHERGDAALRDAAFVFRQSFRQTDVVSRLGGDEFVAYTMDDEHPGVILERIQANLDAFNMMEDRPYVLAMSAGVVQCNPASEQTLSDYLLLADEQMYVHKRRRLH
jgi:diguanylate cyclase (GGDEF)-like protein